MSDEEIVPPKADPLAAFRLGPSWAKEVAKVSPLEEFRDHEPRVERRGGGGGGGGGRGAGRGGERGRGVGGGGYGGGQGQGAGGQGRRDDRGGGRRDERGGYGRRDERGGRGGGGGYDRRDDRGGRPEPVAPAQGVRIELRPSREAVALIAREVQQVARVYSLFEIAQVLLADRTRYRLRIRANDKAAPFYRSRKDDSLWLTKQEAMAHARNAPWLAELYEQETIEVSPPRGNFQAVARCGLSGEWLGPPNYHGYQTALRRLHRERFSQMPFERYAANVRTERGEEAVNAWLATMTTHTRWRPVGGGDEDWMTDRAEVERHFARSLFDQVFEETKDVELPGDVAARNLSLALLESLKLASSYARKHPAMLIPPVCEMLERLHLPVFKRDGRLFTGPARPHPLASDVVLAERPAAIIGWLAGRGQAKLGDLWSELLPEGQEGPCEQWLGDLLWLLNGGHVLLFADDTMVLPGRRPDPPAAREKKQGADDPAGPRAGKQQAPKQGVRNAGKQTKEKPAKRKRPRRPKPSILVRRSVEKMTLRQLKKVRGAERVWRHRLIMRQVRRAVGGPEEEVA